MYFEIPVVFVVNAENEEEAAKEIIQRLVDRTYYNPGNGPQQAGNEPWPTKEGKPIIDTWFLPNHRPDDSDHYNQRLVWQRHTNDPDGDVKDFYVNLVVKLWPNSNPPSNDEILAFVDKFIPNRGWIIEFTYAIEKLHEALYDEFEEYRKAVHE